MLCFDYMQSVWLVAVSFDRWHCGWFADCVVVNSLWFACDRADWGLQQFDCFSQSMRLLMSVTIDGF